MSSRPSSPRDNNYYDIAEDGKYDDSDNYCDDWENINWTTYMYHGNNPGPYNSVARGRFKTFDHNRQQRSRFRGGQWRNSYPPKPFYGRERPPFPKRQLTEVSKKTDIPCSDKDMEKNYRSPNGEHYTMCEQRKIQTTQRSSSNLLSIVVAKEKKLRETLKEVKKQKESIPTQKGTKYNKEQTAKLSQITIPVAIKLPQLVIKLTKLDIKIPERTVKSPEVTTAIQSNRELQSILSKQEREAKNKTILCDAVCSELQNVIEKNKPLENVQPINNVLQQTKQDSQKEQLVEKGTNLENSKLDKASKQLPEITNKPSQLKNISNSKPVKPLTQSNPKLEQDKCHKKKSDKEMTQLEQEIQKPHLLTTTPSQNSKLDQEVKLTKEPSQSSSKLERNKAAKQKPKPTQSKLEHNTATKPRVDFTLTDIKEGLENPAVKVDMGPEPIVDQVGQKIASLHQIEAVKQNESNKSRRKSIDAKKCKSDLKKQNALKHQMTLKKDAISKQSKNAKHEKQEDIKNSKQSNEESSNALDVMPPKKTSKVKDEKSKTKEEQINEAKTREERLLEDYKIPKKIRHSKSIEKDASIFKVEEEITSKDDRPPRKILSRSQSKTEEIEIAQQKDEGQKTRVLQEDYKIPKKIMSRRHSKIEDLKHKRDEYSKLKEASQEESKSLRDFKIPRRKAEDLKEGKSKEDSRKQLEVEKNTKHSKQESLKSTKEERHEEAKAVMKVANRLSLREEEHSSKLDDFKIIRIRRQMSRDDYSNLHDEAVPVRRPSLREDDDFRMPKKRHDELHSKKEQLDATQKEAKILSLREDENVHLCVSKKLIETETIKEDPKTSKNDEEKCKPTLTKIDEPEKPAAVHSRRLISQSSEEERRPEILQDPSIRRLSENANKSPVDEPQENRRHLSNIDTNVPKPDEERRHSLSTVEHTMGFNPSIKNMLGKPVEPIAYSDVENLFQKRGNKRLTIKGSEDKLIDVKRGSPKNEDKTKKVRLSFEAYKEKIRKEDELQMLRKNKWLNRSYSSPTSVATPTGTDTSCPIETELEILNPVSEKETQDKQVNEDIQIVEEQNKPSKCIKRSLQSKAFRNKLRKLFINPCSDDSEDGPVTPTTSGTSSLSSSPEQIRPYRRFLDKSGPSQAREKKDTMFSEQIKCEPENSNIEENQKMDVQNPIDQQKENVPLLEVSKQDLAEKEDELLRMPTPKANQETVIIPRDSIEEVFPSPSRGQILSMQVTNNENITSNMVILDPTIPVKEESLIETIVIDDDQPYGVKNEFPKEPPKQSLEQLPRDPPPESYSVREIVTMEWFVTKFCTVFTYIENTYQCQSQFFGTEVDAMAILTIETSLKKLHEIIHFYEVPEFDIDKFLEMAEKACKLVYRPFKFMLLVALAGMQRMKSLHADMFYFLAIKTGCELEHEDPTVFREALTDISRFVTYSKWSYFLKQLNKYCNVEMEMPVRCKVSQEMPDLSTAEMQENHNCLTQQNLGSFNQQNASELTRQNSSGLSQQNPHNLLVRNPRTEKISSNLCIQEVPKGRELNIVQPSLFTQQDPKLTVHHHAVQASNRIQQNPNIIQQNGRVIQPQLRKGHPTGVQPQVFFQQDTQHIPGGTIHQNPSGYPDVPLRTNEVPMEVNPVTLKGYYRTIAIPTISWQPRILPQPQFRPYYYNSNQAKRQYRQPYPVNTMVTPQSFIPQDQQEVARYQALQKQKQDLQHHEPYRSEQVHNQIQMYKQY